MQTQKVIQTIVAKNNAGEAYELLHSRLFLPLCRELVHRPEGINRLGTLQCPPGGKGGRKAQSIDLTSGDCAPSRCLSYKNDVCATELRKPSFRVRGVSAPDLFRPTVGAVLRREEEGMGVRDGHS